MGNSSEYSTDYWLFSKFWKYGDKFNWLSNGSRRRFSHLVLKIVFSLILASKFYFLLKSKWHLSGLAFIPLFSNHSKMDVENFSNWFITSSRVFLCSMLCYFLLSLQSLCHYKKETSHKNISNKSGLSIDPCVTLTTISTHELNWSFILTLYLRSVKWLFLSFNDSVEKPYAWSFASIRSCGRQSKALERSVSKAPYSSPWSNTFFAVFYHG